MSIKHPGNASLNRRDFLKTGSFATLGAMLGAGGVALKAQAPHGTGAPAAVAHSGPPVPCALIGAGLWGREILANLARLPHAPVQAVCETYPAFLRRASILAPEAEGTDDYRRVLDNKEIQAVIIATPSHQHRDIAIAALQAGKHVYCEAPLASNIEDARAIARAAKAASGQVFQVGQQIRSEPQHHHVVQFLRLGALGTPLTVKSQWNRKTSWRRAAPTSEREREINWRLRHETSPGLLGEIGLHQIDVVSWFLRARPLSVVSYGGIMHWKDGREVADTVHTIFEYPGGLLFNYSCTLGNSFQGDYEIFYGTDSAIMIRDSQAWMFKEADAPLLGWEVYARRDQFLTESGIALVANATQLIAQGLNPADVAQEAEPALYYSLGEFFANISESKAPNAGYREGFEAAVVALKANEALVKGEKISLQDSWFDLG